MLLGVLFIGSCSSNKQNPEDSSLGIVQQLPTDNKDKIGNQGSLSTDQAGASTASKPPNQGKSLEDDAAFRIIMN